MKRLLPLALLCMLPFLPSRATAQEPLYSNPLTSPSPNLSVDDKRVREKLDNIIASTVLPLGCNFKWPSTYLLRAYKKPVGYLKLTPGKSLEFKIDTPIPYVGNFLNLFGDFNIREDVHLEKINDSTYVEIVNKEEYFYEKRNNVWFCTDFENIPEYKHGIKGQPIKGEPIVDVLEKMISGTNIDTAKIFLFYLPYEGPIPDGESSENYELLSFDMEKFKFTLDGEDVPLVKDKDILFGSLTVLFCKNNPLAAIGSVNPLRLPFGIFSTYVEMIKQP